MKEQRKAVPVQRDAFPVIAAAPEAGKTDLASATWVPHRLVRNPDRRWWQCWKRRCAWVPTEERLLLFFLVARRPGSWLVERVRCHALTWPVSVVSACARDPRLQPSRLGFTLALRGGWDMLRLSWDTFYDGRRASSPTGAPPRPVTLKNVTQVEGARRVRRLQLEL